MYTHTFFFKYWYSFNTRNLYQNHYDIVDAVASTVHTTVDSTKNVASCAYDKGTTFIGGVKGIDLNN